MAGFMGKGHLGGYIKSDDQEFQNGDPATYTPAVWSYLLDIFRPRLVIDVGCGEAHSTRFFQNYASEDILVPTPYAIGIDGVIEARQKELIKLDDFYIHDFSKGAWQVPAWINGLQPRPIMIWSCEFVEHVEEKFADNFLQAFDLADVVCMTHAFPNQGGYHHVNCQRPEYWVSKMELRGFILDQVRSDTTRKIEPESHWGRSGLIFKRKQNI